MSNTMKVYRIVYDDQPHIVEAESFGLAIIVWRDAMREPWGTDWEGTEEPESVELVHNHPVIRKLPKESVQPSSGPFPCWAIVELLGHRRVCGYVSEVDVCGRGFLRVEIPATAMRPAAEQYQGAGSVYAITPTTQAYCETHAWEAQCHVPDTMTPETEYRYPGPGPTLPPESPPSPAEVVLPERRLCERCSDPEHDRYCDTPGCPCPCAMDQIPF